MTNPAPGTLAWFEVATDDPDGAEKFYGSLFDWSFNADGPAAAGGIDYRNVTASGADGPMGGIFGTGGQLPGHAVFYILVADVEATCVDAEQLGGSVVEQAPRPRSGRPHLRLPAGPVGQPVRRVLSAGGLMAQDPHASSPSEQSGERTPAPSMTSSPMTCSTTRPWPATMMGHPCVRLAGRFQAAYDPKVDCLVVKLPRDRVTELVDQERGDPFAPAAFRESVAITTVEQRCGAGLAEP